MRERSEFGARRLFAIIALLVLALWPARAVAVSNATSSGHGEEPPTRKERKSAESAEILGWLLISTDAAATVRVGTESLGTLEPGDTLRHGITSTTAVVSASAIDAPAAVWRETVSLLVKARDEESGEDESEEVEEEGAVPSEAEEDAPEKGPLGATVDGEEPAARKVRKSVKVRIRMLQAIQDLRKKERRESVWPNFETGLMWSKQDNRQDVTWSKAMRHCASSRLGGWEDWRLPDIDELATLQAMWSLAAFKTIGPVSLSACCEWSASEIDEARAWNYNFRFRRKFEGQKGYSYDLRALCVRSLTAEEITAHQEALAEAKKTKKENKKKRGRTRAADQSDPPKDPILDSGGG